MNAEKLHAICIAIKEEIDENSIINYFEQLTQALQNVANNPNPNHQNALGDKLTKFYDALDNVESDNFSPVWRQILEGVQLASREDKVL